MEKKKNCSCMKCITAKRNEYHKVKAQAQAQARAQAQAQARAQQKRREMKQKYESDLQKAINRSIEDEKLKEKEQHDIEKAIRESAVNNSVTGGEDENIDDCLLSMINNLEIDNEQEDVKVITSRKRDRECDIYKYEHNTQVKKPNTYNYNEIENKNEIEKHKHINFIVGRGRVEFKGGLNIPLSPIFTNSNNVFIDGMLDVEPDIAKPLSDVDFTQFGITKEQDPENKIDVKILFDWSSAYCGGIQSIHRIAQQLRRPFEIYIPFSNSENKIPSDIKNILWQPVYDFILEDGYYPLFDWTIDVLQSSNRHISDHVNPNHYLKILFRIRKR